MARKSTLMRGEMTAEELAQHDFLEAEQALDKAWAEVNKADKDTPELMKKLDRLRKRMFGAFDNWQHVITNTVTVPVNEFAQLALDALMANIEAMPDTEEMSGLERHRHCKEIANDLYSLLKGVGVHVREFPISAPEFCPSCEAEMAA